MGYLLALVGSIIFGFIGDRYGRKRALTLSILAMAIPISLISILPGYQSIDIAAPILITLLRVIQGFVASSEFSGSAIFLVEHAKPGRKAFYGCLTSSAYSTGVVLMLLLSFPVFYLLAFGSVALITLGMVLMSVLIATAFAPMNAYMVELFPEACRYSGFGVSFHIGISLLGGTTPLVLMWLVDKTGNFTAPAYYYVVGALIGLGSLVLCEYGRRGIDRSPVAVAC